MVNSAPPPADVVHDHVAAVVGDDPPALRQAEAQAAARLAAAEEGIEQMAADRVRNAGPVVADDHFGPALAVLDPLAAAVTATCPSGPTASIALVTTAAIATANCVASAADRDRCRRPTRSASSIARSRGQLADARRPLARTICRRSSCRDFELRRPGEEHQVGDHLVGPHRLAMDGRELPPPLRIGLVFEQRLRAGGDVGQRIVDLVAGAVGQLLERVELFALEPRRRIRPIVRRSRIGYQCSDWRSRREIASRCREQWPTMSTAISSAWRSRRRATGRCARSALRRRTAS